MMPIQCFICPPYQSNAYYMIDRTSHQVLMIDAGPGSFEALQKQFDAFEIQIWLTHGHWDHMADAKKFQTQCSAKVFFHKADLPLVCNQELQQMIAMQDTYQPFTQDGWLEENTKIVFGGYTFQILSIPGHTLGSVGIYNETDGCLFPGDTLFYHAIGRTDIGGSAEQLRQSLQVLSQLPADTVVYGGHGPATSIREEHLMGMLQKCSTVN